MAADSGFIGSINLHNAAEQQERLAVTSKTRIHSQKGP